MRRRYIRLLFSLSLLVVYLLVQQSAGQRVVSVFAEGEHTVFLPADCMHPPAGSATCGRGGVEPNLV